MRLGLLLPDNVEDGWLLGLQKWKDFILELLLDLVILTSFEVKMEFTLMSHHKCGKQDVPVAEDDFAVVLDNVSQSQTGMELDLKIRIWII